MTRWMGHLWQMHWSLPKEGQLRTTLSVLSELACQWPRAGNMVAIRGAFNPFTRETFHLYFSRWKLNSLICVQSRTWFLQFWSLSFFLISGQVHTKWFICLGFHWFPLGRTLVLKIVIPVTARLLKRLSFRVWLLLFSVLWVTTFLLRGAE